MLETAGNLGWTVFDLVQVNSDSDLLMAVWRIASDSFPFGEKIDARTYVSGEVQRASDKGVHNEYRYGFNGKEDDLT